MASMYLAGARGRAARTNIMLYELGDCIEAAEAADDIKSAAILSEAFDILEKRA